MLKTVQKARYLAELQKSQQPVSHAMDRFLLNGQNSQRRSSTKDIISPLPIQYQLFLKLHETPVTALLLTIVPAHFLSRIFFFFPMNICYLKRENSYDLSHRKCFYNIK